MSDLAFGRRSGGGGAEKASPPKEKKAAQFQVMRARARAGKLTKSANKKDGLHGGDTVRTNVRPKMVNVMKKQVTKQGIVSDQSSNNPYLQPKGYKRKPGSGWGG